MTTEELRKGNYVMKELKQRGAYGEIGQDLIVMMSKKYENYILSLKSDGVYIRPINPPQEMKVTKEDWKDFSELIVMMELILKSND